MQQKILILKVRGNETIQDYTENFQLYFDDGWTIKSITGSGKGDGFAVVFCVLLEKN